MEIAFIGVGSLGSGTLNVTNGGKVESNALLGVGRFGTLNITGGGQVTNDASIVGSSATGTGIATVDGPGSIWMNDESLAVYGTLTVSNEARVEATTLTVGAIGEMHGDGNVVSAVQNGGTVRGNLHFIGSVENAGLVSPGTSPGALNIDGNYTQTADGELLIELASDSSYDRLLVTDDATLAGTLTVSLIEGFVPSPGQSFTFLTSDDVDGTFTTEVFPSVPNLAFDVIYNPNSVVLMVSSVGVPGDYNLDGAVDAADYVVWRKNDGTPQGYDTWRAHFGETIGSGSTGASPSRATVPETCTLTLALAGLSIWTRRRVNHRRKK